MMPIPKGFHKQKQGALRSGVSRWAMALFMLVAALPAMAGVTMAPAASPASSSPGGADVAVVATGFPAGTLDPAQVQVLFAPAVANTGASASGTALRITTIYGNQRLIVFRVPDSLVQTAPVAYLVSLQGQTTTGTAFTSDYPAALTIAPPALVSGVSPAAGEWEVPVSVAISGSFTNFTSGATMASFGAGISVGGAAAGDYGPVTVTSPTSATAQLVVSKTAAAGFRTVSVRTGLEAASLSNGFAVIVRVPAISAVNPAYVQTGLSNIPVQVTGAFTHFAQGSTAVSFGADVVVNSVTVGSATSLVANVTVPANAAVGFRAVTATTGTEVATLPGAFSVVPDPVQALPAGRNEAYSTLSVVFNSAPATGGWVSFVTGRNEAMSAFRVVSNLPPDVGGWISLGTGRNEALSAQRVVANMAPMTGGWSSFDTGRNEAFGILTAAWNSNPTLDPANYVAHSKLLTVQNGAPDSGAASGRLVSSSSAAGGLRLVRTGTTQAEFYTAGSTVQLVAYPEALGEIGSVEFVVNGSVMRAVTAAPYQVALTLPGRAAKVQVQAVVRDKAGKSLGRMERQLVVAEVAAVELAGPVTGSEELVVELEGLKAEHYDLNYPVTGFPDFAKATPSANGFVSSLNWWNPEGVFGVDPQGTQLAPDFASRFTGALVTEKAGMYGLHVRAHAAAEVLVDGKVALEIPLGAARTAESSVSLELTAGRHQLEVRHLATAGNTELVVEWTPPGGVRQPLLGSDLRAVVPGVKPDGGEVRMRGIPAHVDTVRVAGQAVQIQPARIVGMTF